MTGIKKLGPKFKSIAGVIDLATKDGGLLDNLRASIERNFTQANLKLRQGRFKIGAGRVVERVGDDMSDAVADLAQRRAERPALTDERSEISQQLDAVTARVGKAKGKTRDRLIARQVKLQERLDEANERVQQNEEDIYDAQEEVKRLEEQAAQKRKDDAIKLVEDVKKRYSSALASNDIFKRMAAAVGNVDWLNSLNQKQADLITDQANELEGKIAGLRAAGANEEADALVAEVADLRAQVFEIAQQALRDAMDAIGKTASRKRTVSDLFGRMADAIGVVGQGVAATIGDVGGIGGLGSKTRAQVAQDRIDTSVEERAGYVELAQKAKEKGNIGLYDELVDKINELTVEIAENTKAAYEAKLADINTSHKGNDLLAKGNELNTLLADLTPGTQQYKDLQKAIKENEVATKQNTVALNELTGAGSAPVSFSSLMQEWFDRALLTGTGGVLPQYQVPSTINTGGAGAAGGASSIVNNGSTVNIEVNEAGGEIDPVKIASKVTFAQSVR
jgi:seryl-tRNA synthetase